MIVNENMLAIGGLEGIGEIPLLDANGNPVLRSFPFGQSYCDAMDTECAEWMLRRQGLEMKARGATTPVFGDPDYDAYVEATNKAGTINIPWTAAVPPPQLVSKPVQQVIQNAVQKVTSAPQGWNTGTQGADMMTEFRDTVKETVESKISIPESLKKDIFGFPLWMVAAGGVGAYLVLGRGR